MNDPYDENNRLPWFENKHISSLDDRRIPDELLLTAEAQRMFLYHQQAVEAKKRRAAIKTDFKEKLARSPQVISAYPCIFNPNNIVQYTFL